MKNIINVYLMIAEQKKNFLNLLLFLFTIFNYYIYQLTNIYFYISILLLLISLNYNIILRERANKLQKFDFKNIKYLILIILLIIAIFYLLFIFSLIPKYYPSNFYTLLTSKLVKETFLIILIVFFYLIFFLKKFEKNYFMKFLTFFFYLSIFLYNLTLIDIFFIQSEELKMNLHEWGRPLIHLSFFQNYRASKLQHAFIFYILFSFFIYNYIEEKNSFIKNLIIANAIFLIFLINSKLYYTVFFIYIFQAIIFNSNKKMIKKIFQTLILLIIIFLSFSYVVNKTEVFKNSNYKFSIIDNLILKFYYELKSLKLTDNDYLRKNQIILYLENNMGIIELSTKKKIEDDDKETFLFYYNSQKERNIIDNFCILNKGLIFHNKINTDNFLSDLKINNSSLFTEYKKITNIEISANCESSFQNLIFYLGNLAYLLFFIFIISYLFVTLYYKNYFLFFNLVPVTLLLNFHHIFFNLALVILIFGSSFYSKKIIQTH